jgi:hypothetical protein
MAPSARSRFKRALAAKTTYSLRNDGLDVLVYLAYVKFLHCVQARVEELKAHEGTSDNMHAFYRQAVAETLPRFRG